MLSPSKLAFCIYQNHKEQHCVDLIIILAMIEFGLWQMATLWLKCFVNKREKSF